MILNWFIKPKRRSKRSGPSEKDKGIRDRHGFFCAFYAVSKRPESGDAHGHHRLGPFVGLRDHEHPQLRPRLFLYAGGLFLLCPANTSGAGQRKSLAWFTLGASGRGRNWGLIGINVLRISRPV